MSHASIGIDLGTSNSAAAIAQPEGKKAIVVELAQYIDKSAVASKSLLPSVLYIPLPEEGKFALPWDPSPQYVVGEFARQRAAAVPDRVVASAKSWLCNPSVDRTAAILPWKSGLTEGKCSPLEASRLYLDHIRHGIESSLSGSVDLGSASYVVTVPASFDEVARTLTAQAAEQAGLAKVTLLEEPLAALYAWIDAHDNWREQLRPGDVLLVCDLGGGTTDFTLVLVSESQGNLELLRLSVGEHILLGGDNMDLALAYALRESFGAKLDNWQFQSLVHAARRAKEELFDRNDLSELSISISGRGSSLFASTLSAALKRDLFSKVILDGFFPSGGPSDLPRERAAAGLVEFGLPYAQDAAVTRHLAKFLRDSLENVRAQIKHGAAHLSEYLAKWEQARLVEPTKLLFNGGVFKACAIRERLKSVIQSWCNEEVIELPGADFDQAVARGAAAYGNLKLTGKGIRVRAGAARTLYLGVESSMPAVPGLEPPLQGVCIVPQGLEEGSEVRLEGRRFNLVTGEPVHFRFFSSTTRAVDPVGFTLESVDELHPIGELSVTLPAREEKREIVPVQLHAVFTELGTLELWMQALQTDQRWKLEYNVRG